MKRSSFITRLDFIGNKDAWLPVQKLVIPAMLLCMLSCTNKARTINSSPVWTEAQKRQFYTDSFGFTDRDYPDRRDSITSFVAFMHQQYPDLKAKNTENAFIYALEEPYIDTTQIDTARKWFRLTVAPCFERPYCLVIEKKKDRSFLTIKITNGDGGYYTGTLVLSMKLEFDDTLYNNLSKRLSELNFWALPVKDTTCHGVVDGEYWTIEAIGHGKYNMINRSNPDYCRENTTRQLANIGLHLKDISGLEKILTLIETRNRRK